MLPRNLSGQVFRWKERQINKIAVMNCVLPKFLRWSPIPQYLRIWLYLERKSLKSNYVKKRSSPWTLMQYNWCSHKNRKVEHRCTQREDCEDTGRRQPSASQKEGLHQDLNLSEPWSWTFQSYAAAAAKSLQSCPTLCDPIDGSPPGSAIPGILQARTLEWVAISFSNSWKWKVKVKSLSRIQPSVTPWTAAYQAPLSMGFSRQECWSGVPLPSPSQSYKSMRNISLWLKPPDL